MPETVTIRCHCGTAVVYDNPNVGCTNIGHFERVTGWFTAMECMDNRSLGICPKCMAKLRIHVQAIIEILGTANVSIAHLLPTEQ